ncbi:hypothetical protein ABLE68_04970 [Nocardioides sp. CN2-186]|uniref:hypothetical protein n=1 Tax=Nocardioides tweenelious TaxID=3156607 RepID=UPI0032B5A3AC
MTIQANSPRPQRTSAAAAMLRVIVTLAMFLIVFITFLIAPLVALGLAFLVYLVARSRGSRSRPVDGVATTPQASATGFGAGAA